MISRKLILVDGSSYLYRAFHALPPLSNSKGEPTAPDLGVLNMMNKMIKEESPDRIAGVFDAPGRTFRDDLFEQYKAHPAPMPDDLRSQAPPLLDTVAAMGLPLLRVSGVEADDVIGTLALQGAESDYDVLISTGDKDMAQLVGPRIGLINTMSNTRLDRAGVKAKFDVFPEQIVDYLALVGDSSDNIPGIAGVGPKTAAKWLNEYGPLDELIAHAGDVGGKVGENLRNGLAILELSRKLATIDTTLRLDIAAEGLVAGAPDLSRLRELYTRLELRALLKALGSPLEPPPGSAVVVEGVAGEIATPAGAEAVAVIAAVETLSEVRDYHKILSQDALDAWLAKLAAAPLMSFDTQSDSLDYMQARIVGMSFAVAPGEAAYVPLGHDYAGAPHQLDREKVLAAFKPLLEDPAKQKLGHHLKHDAHSLANYGIALKGQRFDSMLESYVLNSVATRHDMDAAAAKYLGIQTIRYEDVAGKGAKQLSFSQVDVDRAAEYSPEQINQSSGRIHTSYHQAVAATGRLSSTDPNLQNIPIRTREGRRIRQAFVAPPGHSLVAADYSQIELRIMAHLSGDASLLRAFAEDRDVHQATAAEVFSTPLGEVSADQRRSAKAINFGLMYGMSAFGLARQLGIGRGDAQKYMDLYFERYPGVKRYMEETRRQARETGFVETVFGRRLYLPEIQSRNQALRQYAERSAINAPMQGTAADIIKRAMIEVDAWLQSSRMPAQLIMQVHDELILEVTDEAVGTLVGDSRTHMIRAADLSIPPKVDVGVGRNWDEAH